MMTPAEYRTARHSLGLTQRQLGERLGLARTTVVRREQGQLPITAEAELALQRLLTRPSDQARALVARWTKRRARS